MSLREGKGWKAFGSSRAELEGVDFTERIGGKEAFNMQHHEEFPRSTRVLSCINNYYIKNEQLWE